MALNSLFVLICHKQLLTHSLGHLTACVSHSLILHSVVDLLVIPHTLSRGFVGHSTHCQWCTALTSVPFVCGLW